MNKDKDKDKEKEKEKTKRKGALVSSHSDNESNDYGPLLTCDNSGPALSDIYKDRGDDLESRLRYKPRPGETVIEEELYIPDVDHG